MLAGPEVSTNATGTMQTSERRCENPDCNINKLISMVPKRKPTQFVSNPLILDKPMLVNGFTAVFQVDGGSARLLDIKNPNGDSQAKTIYRIIPNSHVHVVNYVVVDTDEAYLRKITENDPVTMQKLLTSQKESADQMLKKIMSGQGSSATAAMTTVVSTINNNSITSNSTLQGGTSNNGTTMACSIAGQPADQQNSIKLPLRMHPNLKITAVASGESVNTVPTAPLTAPTTAPFITPVPLTNLQATAILPAAAQQPLSSVATTSINPLINPIPSDSKDKSTYDKMQAEINDLRRTVAMLAEAQAKNQQPVTSNKSAKRPRNL